MTGLVSGRPVDAVELVHEIADRTGGLRRDASAVIHALCELLPADRWPTVLVTQPDEGRTGPGWLAGAVKALEPVAAAVPRLPVAVVASEDEYIALTSGSGVARHQALAREGYVPVRGVSAGELASRLSAVGIAPPHAESLDRLTADGLSEGAAVAFVEAAKAVKAGDGSDARSKAEQFLYEHLNEVPATAGLFHLNRPLAFRHGPRAAEADLVADGLKIVVEVDGAYFHLTHDQYRSDRRKDWLYQTHGYLVLRFLAEDVYDHLDPIVATVLQAVALRRSIPPTREVALD